MCNWSGQNVGDRNKQNKTSIRRSKRHQDRMSWEMSGADLDLPLILISFESTLPCRWTLTHPGYAYLLADLVQSHYSLGKPTETGWAELQTLTVPPNVVWHNWSLNTQEQISIRSIPKTDCILKWTVKPPSPAHSLHHHSCWRADYWCPSAGQSLPRWVLITCLLCSDALDTVAPFKTECVKPKKDAWLNNATQCALRNEEEKNFSCALIC